MSRILFTKLLYFKYLMTFKQFLASGVCSESPELLIFIFNESVAFQNEIQLREAFTAFSYCVSLIVQSSKLFSSTARNTSEKTYEITLNIWKKIKLFYINYAFI